MTLESNFAVEKRKAEEEIASLQQLVHGNSKLLLIKVTFKVRIAETVEESTSSRTIYDTELRKMHVYIRQLQNEIEELKSEKEKQQSPHHTIVVSLMLLCFNIIKM